MLLTEPMLTLTVVEQSTADRQVTDSISVLPYRNLLLRAWASGAWLERRRKPQDGAIETWSKLLRVGIAAPCYRQIGLSAASPYRCERLQLIGVDLGRRRSVSPRCHSTLLARRGSSGVRVTS